MNPSGREEKAVRGEDLRKYDLPWIKTYRGIKSRTDYKSDTNYKRYGGKGIKCLITSEELKTIWFRDKAYLLKKPSIDRIDPDGNYEFNNYRYIEFSENCRMGRLRLSRYCPQGHEFTPENTYYDNKYSKVCKRYYRGRVCRACKKEHGRKRWIRRKS